MTKADSSNPEETTLNRDPVAASDHDPELNDQSPFHRATEEAAFDIYEMNGCQVGSREADWRQAEGELTKEIEQQNVETGKMLDEGSPVPRANRALPKEIPYGVRFWSQIFRPPISLPAADEPIGGEERSTSKEPPHGLRQGSDRAWEAGRKS